MDYMYTIKLRNVFANLVTWQKYFYLISKQLFIETFPAQCFVKISKFDNEIRENNTKYNEFPSFDMEATIVLFHAKSNK